MEAQIKELENLSSQIKNNTTTSRQEVLKKMKENENELKELTKVNKNCIFPFKFLIQLQNNQTKMVQQIAKKKNRFDKIQKELPFFMNSMVCLGQDVNKTEYWVKINFKFKN